MESENSDNVVSALDNKEYRHLLCSAAMKRCIAQQIRETHLSRGWTQAELARRMGTKQEFISRLEEPSYGRYSLNVLKKLASVFDVALIARFAPFSVLSAQVADLTPDDLAVPGFDDDIERAALDGETAA